MNGRARLICPTTLPLSATVFLMHYYLRQQHQSYSWSFSFLSHWWLTLNHRAIKGSSCFSEGVVAATLVLEGVERPLHHCHFLVCTCTGGTKQRIRSYFFLWNAPHTLSISKVWHTWRFLIKSHSLVLLSKYNPICTIRSTPTVDSTIWPYTCLLTFPSLFLNFNNKPVVV